MEIKLWGVRGSLPSPLTNEEYHAKIKSILKFALDSKLTDPSKIDILIDSLPDQLKYLAGGNTTCATVNSDDGRQFIIDCGTGMRHLGYMLAKGACGKGEGNLDIFITHNHWDHIQGLPFFLPLYIKGNTLTFHSPFKGQEDLLIQQMSPPFFPAAFKDTQSTKIFKKLEPKGDIPLKFEGGMVIDCHPLRHPGGSFAYRFRQNGKTFIFATDAEFTGDSIEMLNSNSGEFFYDADLLVLDAQYTLDESFTKFDWGHTSVTMAVNCAIRWNIKKLVLTHHEPAYDDEKLNDNLQIGIEHRNITEHTKPEIILAREGLILEV